jgi:putative membrane protein
MRVSLMVPSFLLLAVASAAAQIGNPGGMLPGTVQKEPGVPAPHQANTQDRLFALLAAAGGLAEVDAGKLAQQKGQNNAVKEFGGRMVRDHSQANDQLGAIAKAAGIPLPAEPDAEYKAKRTALEKLSGAQFDLVYMQNQVVDHQKTATLLQWEISFGQDADLQRFAAAALPTVLAHLQLAQNVLAQLTGQAPQGAAPAVAVRQ